MNNDELLAALKLAMKHATRKELENFLLEFWSAEQPKTLEKTIKEYTAQRTKAAELLKAFVERMEEAK